MSKRDLLTVIVQMQDLRSLEGGISSDTDEELVFGNVFDSAHSPDSWTGRGSPQRHQSVHQQRQPPTSEPDPDAIIVQRVAVGGTIVRGHSGWSPLHQVCFHSHKGLPDFCNCSVKDGCYVLCAKDRQLEKRGTLVVDDRLINMQRNRLKGAKPFQPIANLDEILNPICQSAIYIDARARQLTWHEQQTVKLKFLKLADEGVDLQGVSGESTQPPGELHLQRRGAAQTSQTGTARALASQGETS